MLAAPVVLLALALGQTPLIFAGLLVLALEAMRRDRVVLAGLAIAAMTLKPQLGLAIPIALLAGGHWRVILWACVGAAAVLASSLIWPGLDYWPAFLTAMREASDHMRDSLLPAMMITGYGAGTKLGLSHEAALGVHFAISLAVAVALGWLWASRAAFDLKAAALALAVILLTPYAIYYELVFGLVGVVYLARAGSLDRVGTASVGGGHLAGAGLRVRVVDRARLHVCGTPNRDSLRHRGGGFPCAKSRIDLKLQSASKHTHKEEGPSMEEAARLSLIVPVLNEEATVATFLEESGRALDAAVALMPEGSDAEWVFVNDGSTDATEVVLTKRAESDSRIKLINLSRNFGKEAALAAGLDHATGDAVIPIDVDLQDPPEVIVEMVGAWLDGAEVVNARRADRSSDTLSKRVTSSWFYKLYNKIADQPIPENVGDFRLLGKQAVEVIRKLPEQSRFNKGLFNWVGFPVTTIEYQRAPRVAGETKWRAWRLWNLALDGITASTTVPLRIWTYVGAVIAGLAFVYALFLVVYTMIFGADAPGFASIMIAVLGLGGLQLLSLGIMGEYVGRIATEVRGRPLYVVASTVGF